MLTVATLQVCQFPGTITFETERSFVEPTPENKSALQDLVAYARNPGPYDLLLIVGHTDSTGSDEYNLRLSRRRAQAVYALLSGDVAEWETLFGREGWSSLELEQMVVETGEADPNDPAGLAQAVNRYTGSGNRAARVTLFTNYFAALLGFSGTPPIQFVQRDSDPPWLGCGEQYLLRGDRSSPSRDPGLPPITGNFRPNRRVEFFFTEQVSIAISCSEYPNWTLACSLPSPGPLVVEWFVSASLGQDTPTHDGSRERPFRTIQYAVDHVAVISTAATKVIKVMDGTYRENVRLISGIVVKADQGAAPVVERSSSGAPVFTCDSLQEVAIEGLIIRGRDQTEHGIMIRNSRDVEVADCWIEHCRSDDRGGGILVEGSRDIRVARHCRVSQNFARRGGGIAVVDSTQVRVENSEVERNQAGTAETAFTQFDINVSWIPPGLDEVNAQVGDAHGGGLYLENSGGVFINNNAIHDNQAVLFGGGIAVDNRERFSGQIEITENEITCNQVSHASLQSIQPSSIDCRAPDMGDPVWTRVNDALPGIAPDWVADTAVGLLHGAGLENGLGGGIALRHVTPQTRLVHNRIGVRQGQGGNFQAAPNRARRGGGISCYLGAYPHIEDNEIAHNLASDDGGGIAIDQFDPFLPAAQPNFLGLNRGSYFLRQPIRMVNNRIRANGAVEDGGGLYATGNAIVEISANISREGDNPALIEGNRAGQNGGGIRVSYATRLTVSGLRITHNESNFVGAEREAGGGIAARNATVHMQDCELSGNCANRFAGGAIYCNSAFEGGFDGTGFLPSDQAGQFDDIMENDYGFGTRRYQFSNCRGSNNQAIGPSGAGGFLYAVRDQGNQGGVERMEIVIDGSATAIGENTSDYDNPGNAGGPRQKRGNVVIELSGRHDPSGMPEDRVNIAGDVPPVPTGVRLSTPPPDNRAVVVIHHDGRPDDNPTSFPYANVGVTISDVQPRIGPVQGSTPITISGAGFLDQPGTEVFIAGVPAQNVDVVSSTTITAETPPLPAPLLPGPVDVEVRNADGQVDTVQGGFEYVVAPRIIDVQPRSGSMDGGTPITITGSDFLAGAEVFIGDLPATDVVVSPDRITATTPRGLVGPADVTVLNPDGQSDTVSGGFDYTLPDEPGPPQPQGRQLTPEEKRRIIFEIARFESGQAGYAAINPDGEFSGDFGTDHPAYQTYHIGLSYGIIQFTQDSGSLGTLLERMRTRDAATFNQVFGAYAAELVRVTTAPGPSSKNVPGGRSARVQPVGGADLWVEPWLSRFRRAANHRPFQEVQEEVAAELYLEPIRQFAAWLGLDTDRALAMVVDRAINMGLAGARAWIIEAVGPVRTAAQRQQALQALGYPNLRRFQEATEGLTVDGAWGPFSHAAMVAALRAMGDASPIQIPTREEMMDAMVRHAAGRRWAHRVEGLRNSNEFDDTPYEDLAPAAPPGRAPTASVQVRNRVFDENVPNVNVQVADNGNVVSQGTTDRAGQVGLSLADLPDGSYRLRATPTDASRVYDGRTELPDVAAGENPPDRIWRALETTVSVRGGRVVGSGSPDVSLSGNQVTVHLQPVWMRSPNRNRRRSGVDITLIVVHHTAGTSSVPRHFINPPPRTSAHYVIARDGHVVKLVHESDYSFHAGCSHWGGSASVNGFSVGIEIVHRPGQDFTAAQYTTLIDLLSQIRRAHPTIPADGIVGHSDIATVVPGNEYCPGPIKRLGVRKPRDPGLDFEWTRLEDEGLGMQVRAGPQPPTIYGGFFSAVLDGRLQRGDNDANRIYGGARRPDITTNVIEELQRDLSAIGYFCPVDGTFGRQTQGAVQMFQVHFFTGPRRRPDREFDQNYGMVDWLTAEMIKSV